MTRVRTSSGASPTQRGLALLSGGRSSAPRRSLVRRPIVELATGRQVGWTVDDDVIEPEWFADVLEQLVQIPAPGEHSGPLIVVPWSAVDETWLHLEPDDRRRRGLAGVVIELPPTRSRGEFEIAAHLLAASLLPACLAFDGNEDTLWSMRRRLDIRVVRVGLAPQHRPLAGPMLPSVIRRLVDDGVAVVVDGIRDEAASEALVREGIRYGQGPRYDRGRG